MNTASLARSLLMTTVLLGFGCGGSDSTLPVDPDPTNDLATLKVLVVENDGQTSGLEGHVFTILETGDQEASGPDGTVPFGPVPPGTLTLRLEGAVALVAQAAAYVVEDEGLPDDEHADPAEVRIEQVQAREQVEVRIHLCHAAMQCVRVSRQLRGECDVEIELERTDANEDPDMGGELELQRDVSRQTFRVEVWQADEGLVLELVVFDLDGTEESQGTRIVDGTGEADWTMDTSAGDTLPFGVDDVRDLEHCGVEVRAALTGTALLVANVPELPPPSGGDVGDTLRGCALLTAVEDGLDGYVEINSRDDGACQSFHMEVHGLAVGRAVEFLLEDPTDADSFLVLGTRTSHGSQGLAHLGLSTSTGDELPGAVASVAELVGLRVEVRGSPDGDLLLFGTVPELIAD